MCPLVIIKVPCTCSCKTWTLTAEHKIRIPALQMRCYRTILDITYIGMRGQVCIAIGPIACRKTQRMEGLYCCCFFFSHATVGQQHWEYGGVIMKGTPFKAIENFTTSGI